MATGKITQAIDRVTPKNPTGLRIIFSKSAADETAITLSAKDDNDYITKKIFNDNSGGVVPDPTVITAGTTETPLTVAYAGNDSTSYTLKRASDGTFDWNTPVAYDGSNFVITGNDDGTGKFADSYIFRIKP